MLDISEWSTVEVMPRLAGMRTQAHPFVLRRMSSGTWRLSWLNIITSGTGFRLMSEIDDLVMDPEGF